MTREDYVEMLRLAALEVADRADELIPTIDHRASLEVAVKLEPDCIPSIEVRQSIHPMEALRFLASRPVKKRKEGDGN